MYPLKIKVLEKNNWLDLCDDDSSL